MRTAWRLVSWIAILAVVVFGTAAGGFAEEDGAVATACRGVLADALRSLRDGDAQARAAAEQFLLGRPAFALPYVRSAAESTADADWRARSLALAARLRRAAGSLIAPTPPLRPAYPLWERLPSQVEPLTPGGPGRDLELARRLLVAERWQDAAETLVAVATEEPARLVEALELAASRDLHLEDAAAPALRRLEALARAAAEQAEPSTSPRIALAVAGWYRDRREERLADMATRHPGTPEALLAEVRVIRSGRGPILQRVARLRALADAHPGTEAAREALAEVAFQYASSNLTREIPDPLERFRLLAGVAARLQSAEFLGSDGALAAVERLTECYFGSAPMSKASAEALLVAYRTFFANHFLLDVIEGPGRDVRYHLISKLKACHASLGVPQARLAAVVDAEIQQLEASLPDRAAIRFLRAERCVAAGRRDEATEVLTAIESAFPDSLYARKALAGRAGLAYAAGESQAAEGLYAEFLERYPSDALAWLAALRIGHCRVLRGETIEAIHAYAEIDPRDAGYPPALAVHRALALGRCHELTGEIDRAVAAYREALAAWHPRGVDEISTEQIGRGISVRPGEDPDAGTSRSALAARVRWLSRPGVDPADLQRLLRGDRLRTEGRTDDALRVWDALAASRSDSPVAAEARERSAVVWVRRALEECTRDAAAPDEAAARAALTKAEETGARCGQVAAALVRAALLLRDGKQADASQRLADALAAYAASQSFREPRGDLEETATALRSAAFAPQDAGYDFDGAARQQARPYVVMSSTARVALPDGTVKLLDLVTPLPHCANVLYFKSSELSLLEHVLDTMSRFLVRGDDPVAERSSDLARLLGGFFSVRPGHWGGWHLFAYPELGEMRIQDAGRTHAVVKFRVGYGGGEAYLDRDAGGWRLTEVDHQWIE